MRKYMSLPIGRLVSDVAVDPVHVRELADSIKVSGPISPVLVREETSELIDGFHRVAAIKELGFDSVECIVTPCDQETFWDLRILSATLHKAVTFARAVDWIDEAFKASPLKEKYTSAHSTFKGVREGRVTGESKDWVESKAKKWGLAVVTIENWLYAKQSMAPELQEELRTASATRREPTYYIDVAQELPTRPDLQKRVLDKVEGEGLGSRGIREVSKAIRGADDEEEVETILREPVSRTAEDLTRAAKVEKLLREPTVIPTPTEKRRGLAGRLLEMYMDLQQQVHVIRQLREREREQLDVLEPSQREELLQVVRDLKAELQWLEDSLVGTVEGQVIVEGKIIEGR